MDWSGPSVVQLRAEAESYLNRVAERLTERGITVQTHVALAEHPASAILDTAYSLGMDLIALETHGRRGLPRLLLGSVADKVIRGASTPVLVHRSLLNESEYGTALDQIEHRHALLILDRLPHHFLRSQPERKGGGGQEKLAPLVCPRFRFSYEPSADFPQWSHRTPTSYFKNEAVFSVRVD